MQRMIAYCGLVCNDCPAYLATQANDEKKARETAELWKKEYGVRVTVADVWCDGCIVEGRKCAHCHECEVRTCGAGRGVKNCGHCPDFSCEKTEKFFAMVPFARDTLRKEMEGR